MIYIDILYTTTHTNTYTTTVQLVMRLYNLT